MHRNLASQKGMTRCIRALNEKNMQPRILYLARLIFRMDGEIKSFQDQQGLKELCDNKVSTTRNNKGGPVKDERTQE